MNDEDIQELHRDHYSDDLIFEAAVCAALGAGLYRLDCVLAIVRADLPAPASDPLSKQLVSIASSAG